MAIKIFPKGSGEQLSENFKAYEFDCPCDNCTETKIDLDLVEILQKNRDHFGKPIGGNRLNAYRCPQHNAETPNAAKASKHMQGMAADFSIEGVTPLEIAAYNESIGVKGIGLYDTFVHVDTRESKAFWYSHAQQPRTTFGGTQAAQKPEKGPVVPVSVYLPVLMNGDSGDTVESVQILLKGKGYNLGKFGPNKDGIDGHFGAATENAVTAFQEGMELENRDGTVGGPEWWALLGL